jgi:CHAD domain-containing protein
MKTKSKTASVGVTRRRAPFCLFGAETLLRYLQALLDEREGVRQAQERECVHRMRVASRRLRSLLPWFASWTPRKQYPQWHKQLRRLTQALGVARDTDVQMAFVRTCLEACTAEHERPGIARLLLRLEQRRQALQAQVIAALDRLEASGVATDMEQTLSQLATQARSYGVGVQAPTVYRKARKAITARLDSLLAYAPYVEQPERVEELHAMRIAAKRLRYIMQACAKLYDHSLEEPVRAAQTLQNMLGDVHDCDVWDQHLSQFLDEERVRTYEYFGQTEPFEPLVPGIRVLQENRQQYRTQRYQEFVAFWQELQNRALWNGLRQTLAAYSPSSRLTTPVDELPPGAADGAPVAMPEHAPDPELSRAAVLDLCRQCHYEEQHAHHVTHLALRLFDAMQPLHGLGAQERFWLECAALLHDIGWVEGQRQHHKTSLRLILESPLLPFETRERLLIGNVARYHRRALPSSAHKPFAALKPADQQCVRVLAGILRVADGLDRTHRSVVQDVAYEVLPEQIVVRCTVEADAEAEYLSARAKGRLFEAVFQRHLEIA